MKILRKEDGEPEVATAVGEIREAQATSDLSETTVSDEKYNASVFERISMFNHWQWFRAVGLDPPSLRTRWTLYLITAMLVATEWFVVVGLLIDKDLPSTTWMVTVTNAALLPGVFLSLYYIMISGTRPDLIVEASVLLLTANASLWYHFCSVPSQMEFCTITECSGASCTEYRDEDEYDLLMHWDFAGSYYLFIVGVMIFVDFRRFAVKLPVYSVFWYLCWEAMKDSENRGETGGKKVEFAMGTAVVLLLLRLGWIIFVIWRTKRVARVAKTRTTAGACADLARSLRELVKCVPLSSGAMVTFLVVGLLCHFEWTDPDAGAGESGYTTPHGFWHIFTQGSSFFLIHCAVGFSRQWRGLVATTAICETAFARGVMGLELKGRKVAEGSFHENNPPV